MKSLMLLPPYAEFSYTYQKGDKKTLGVVNQIQIA